MMFSLKGVYMIDMLTTDETRRKEIACLMQRLHHLFALKTLIHLKISDAFQPLLQDHVTDRGNRWAG